MTEEEREIMDLLVQAHNKFRLLKMTHPNDILEWCDGLHDMQGVIANRIVRRDYPNDFPSYEGSIRVNPDK